MFRIAQLLALVLAFALGPDAAADSTPPAPPAPLIARVAPVTDTHFGEKVVDRYRWMENDRDPDWLPFLKGQDAHARAVLGAVPQRPALLARIRPLSGDVARPLAVQRAGGRVFYQQRPVGANHDRLYVLDGGTSRVLIDPDKLDMGGSHASLDWWRVSPDGSKLAYGLSADGSEDSVLHVMDVDSGAILPERIRDTQIAYPSWLPDSSGFFYNQLTGKQNTPERYLNARARLHRLGQDAARDRIVAARGRSPGLRFARTQLPFVFASAHSRHALLVLSDERSEKRILIAPLRDVVDGKARWKGVADFRDEVTNAELDGEDPYLMAYGAYPRGRVLKVNAKTPSLVRSRTVLPQSPLVLEGFSRAADGLYVRAMEGGVNRILRLGGDGSLAPVALPFDGAVTEIAANPSEPGALITLSGWLHPPGIWRIGTDGLVNDTGLTPRSDVDVSAYVTERRFATTKDGTRIPYSLIYRKGLKKDGSNPAYMSAYGSYGSVAYPPEFAGRLLALADQGAVVGFAHVRGGGEYGREWHRAGHFDNKPNTWRDLIAVCEDMHAEGYTSPARTAIGGRSAGGVAVGGAITERPELFGAAVSHVGWHNALRYVAEPNGYIGETEWGAIGTRTGYRALKLVDSYQAVRDGVRYPAVLLTTGATDQHVAPFHAAKMAARLQAATAGTAGGRPVLLRVDFDAGHGMGSTRAQLDEEAADTYAFILSQTGENPE